MTLTVLVALSVAALWWASRLTVPEPDSLVVSMLASANIAALGPCVEHPDRPAVTTVKVNGHVLAVCAGCLNLAGGTA